MSASSLLDAPGNFRLGTRTVCRMGYGAMQLAGPGVFGPPKDRAEAVAVLREAIASGINHIDTSDYYGPFVTNEIICEALHPYPDDLVIVTKVGARRDAEGAWLPAISAKELENAVLDNLKRLKLDALEVVNLRLMGEGLAPSEGSLEIPFTAMLELQRRGLVKHIGLSQVTRAQVEEARRLGNIACVQNMYNLARRADDPMIDGLAKLAIPYVPFFPLGGFMRLQSEVLAEVAAGLGVSPMQVALAWLLQRAPNILLIPGTSSRAHLRENIAAAALALPSGALERLDGVGR